MAYPSDRETVYANLNTCRSFKLAATTSLQAFSSQVCSEVLIINKSGNPIKVYDNGYSTDANCLLLDDNDTVTLRGLTNSDQVSAKTTASSGDVHYRTQFFSNNPSR